VSPENETHVMATFCVFSIQLKILDLEGERNLISALFEKAARRLVSQGKEPAPVS